ncbi:hypothetical protein D3C77_483030 [compost metagenome]
MNLCAGELLQQLLHNMLNVPLAHRRLIRNDDPLRINLQGIDFLLHLDQVNTIRRNPDGSFRLRMPLLPDINNFVAICYLLLYENMRLGYVRACRVYGSQALVASDFAHLWRYAMRGKYDRTALHLT